MAKVKKVLPSAGQLGLEFSHGSLDLTREIANAVSSSLKKAPISRYHVAARISELVGREITKSMLDHYAGENHERHRIPADLVPALCLVTGSTEVMDVLAEAARGVFASGKDAHYLELVKLQTTRERLEKKIEALRKELL